MQKWKFPAASLNQPRAANSNGAILGEKVVSATEF
jgi:hypothetical protein